MYDQNGLFINAKEGKDFVIKNPDLWTNKTTQGQTLKKGVAIPIKSHKDFYNGKLLVDYSPVYQGLRFSYSLPKLIYGTSFIEPTIEDKAKAETKLRELTSEYLDFDNYDSMNVYRLDNTCNLETKGIVTPYIYSLDNVTEDKIGHKIKADFEGETLSFRSNAETDTFYNKVAEVGQLKGKEVDIHFHKYQHKNILRYEIQYKNVEGIEVPKRYGRKLTWKDLWTEEIVNRTKQLRLITFQNILRERKPKYNFDYSTYVKVLDDMKEQMNLTKKRAVVMNDFAWYVVFSQGLLNIDQVIKLMKGADYTKQAIFKTTKKLRTLQSKARGEHIEELYNLIEEKSKVA